MKPTSSPLQVCRWTWPGSRDDPGWLFRPSEGPTSTSRWVLLFVRIIIRYMFCARVPCQAFTIFRSVPHPPPDSHRVPAGSFWWDPVAVWRTRRPDRGFCSAADSPGIRRVLVSWVVVRRGWFVPEELVMWIRDRWRGLKFFKVDKWRSVWLCFAYVSFMFHASLYEYLFLFCGHWNYQHHRCFPINPPFIPCPFSHTHPTGGRGTM